MSYAWHYNVKKKKSGQPYKSISEQDVNLEVIKLFVNNISFSPDIVEWSKRYIYEMKERELNQKILTNQRKEERKLEYQDKKAKSRAMYRDEKFTQEEYGEDIELLNRQYADVNETTV